MPRIGDPYEGGEKMIVSNATKEMLRKKGYGYMVAGQDIDTSKLSAPEIGVLMRTKNQNNDYLEKVVSLPIVQTRDGDPQLYEYLSKRADNNYAMYNFSSMIPNTVSVGKDTPLFGKGPEEGILHDAEELEDDKDSPLDMERGF